MEKDVSPVMHPPIHDGPYEAQEDKHEVGMEHEAEPEPKEPRIELSRTVSSGPPYTIFSHRAKMFIVVSVSVSSLISPFGATTFYPALNVLAKQLNVSPTLVNLALTTYMVSFAGQLRPTVADMHRSRKQ